MCHLNIQHRRALIWTESQDKRNIHKKNLFLYDISSMKLDSMLEVYQEFSFQSKDTAASKWIDFKTLIQGVTSVVLNTNEIFFELFLPYR